MRNGCSTAPEIVDLSRSILPPRAEYRHPDDGNRAAALRKNPAYCRDGVAVMTALGRSREIARLVLMEAVGASATPFIPVPFVDDFLRTQLLKRVATKVLARHDPPANELAGAVVSAYDKAGARPLASSIAVGAARFIVRKLAIVLDVKKSYDVFGQSLAFAIAVDIAATEGWLAVQGADRIGAAIHHVLESASSGTLESLGRAGRQAYAKGGSPGVLAEAIGAEVDQTRAALEAAMREELARAQLR